MFDNNCRICFYLCRTDSETRFCQFFRVKRLAVIYLCIGLMLPPPAGAAAQAGPVTSGIPNPSQASALSTPPQAQVLSAPLPASAPPASPQLPDLPLPAIPAELRQPAQRAAYLIEHFWDAMDFSDPEAARDSDYMERQLVNYLSVFPHADPSAHGPAVARLAERAETDPESFRLLIRLVEKYLFETDSPLFDEELYLVFLERITASPVLEASELRRPRFLMEALRKNRPGTPAADFDYIARDGGQTTLYSSGTRGSLLLILYDATCAHCREVTAELGRDPLLAQAVGSGRMDVLAICLDADRETLLRSSDGWPAEWMSGFETGGIYDGELYMLRSLPALLILDADKRVLRRNVSPDGVRDFLSPSRRDL